MGYNFNVSTLNQLSAADGGVTGVTLLKQAQDIAGQQAAQLVQSLPQTTPPSPPGVGGNIDEYG